MSISNSSSNKPKIGCQHFKSLGKQILAENNTLASAISDMADNIYGVGKVITEDQCNLFKALCDIKFEYDEGSLYKITVADNILHGFKDIHKNSTENPLNMGHIRLGQSQDRETSEFGTGLKKALIFLAKFAEIYTRCVEPNGSVSYVHIVFDFVEMMNRDDPEDSYEPTRFEIISEEVFRKFHLFETGSTVILSSLRESDITFDSLKGIRLETSAFEYNFRKEISNKMSDLIRAQIIQITVNGENVEVKDDLLSMIPNKVVNTFSVDFNGKNEPTEIYRKSLTPTGRPQIMRYDVSETSFKRADPAALEAFLLKGSVRELSMDSLTTKDTDFEDSHQRFDFTAIKRDGRCFGEVKITKTEKDGYSNHIYHEINYASKQLNNFIGVGSNKRVVSDKSNIIMSAIHITQKEINIKFRKFCKDKKPVVFESSSDSDSSGTPRPRPRPRPPRPPAPAPPAPAPPAPAPAPAPPAPAPASASDPAPTSASPPVSDAVVDPDPAPATITLVIEESESTPSVGTTVVEGIQILNELNKRNNSQDTLNKITKILISYLNNCAQAMLMLKYVPNDNSRILMLLELVDQLYPTEDSKKQVMLESIAINDLIQDLNMCIL
jgi:hypothetical protein